MVVEFPKIDVPNFELLSKDNSWNPKLYQPLIYNESVKEKAENLKPGTLEYDDFWNEMDYYCKYGFQPKNMPRITGRHFYYLNFCKIDVLLPGTKKKKLSNPFYRDLDHWLFLEIETAINNGYGIIIAKPRRVGLSEFGAVNANYELTFYSRNKIGICAGKDDKAQEFYEKLESSLNNIHSAYRNGKIANNNKLLKIGYEDRINKQDVDCGLESIARIKTMYADSSAFEGGSYSLVIFEEIGLFENLTASYAATKPCFMEGDIQFGLPLLYGTGGEVDKGAKGFKEMWDNHLAYNLKRIFVPAYFYYPGDGEVDEDTNKKVSFFNYKTGVTNRNAAKKYIEAKRKIAKLSQETYIKHLQSYPIIPEEVFLKSKGGVLNLVKLQYQLQQIEMGNAPEPVVQGKLRWIDKPEIIPLLNRCKNLKEKTKIRVEHECKVEFVQDENGTIWIDSKPINQLCQHLGYKPDIGGCDSYDEEVDEEKREKNEKNYSSLAMIAYRCFSGPTREYDKPVGLLYERGDASFDDDEAYENAVKFAIHFGIEVLFEYTKFHIIRYFIDVGATEYIRIRPIIEEAGTQNHGNKYGVKMNTDVKAVLVRLLKAEVNQNIYKNFFKPIILDLSDFGKKNTDIAMTLGLCKIHQLDLFGEITEGIEVAPSQTTNSINTGISYYVDFNGELQIQYDNDSENSYVQTFIPERDLDVVEYEKYVKKISQKNQELKNNMSDFEKKAKEMNVDVSLLKLIFDERKKYEN